MKRLCLLVPLLLVTVLLAFAKMPACASQDQLFISDLGDVLGVFASDDNNILILSNFEDNYKITAINNARTVTAYDPETPVFETPYAYDSGHFYFFVSGAEVSDGKILNYVSVRCFDCSTGGMTTKVINGAEPRLSGRFACAGGKYYLMNASDIGVYNAKCRLEGEIPLDANGYSMAASADGSTVYCATSDGVLVIGEDTVRVPISTRNIYPFGSLFSDDDSVVYDKSGREAVFDGFDPTHGVAELGNHLIGRIGGELTAASGDERISLGSAGEDSFICGSGAFCACLEQDGSGANVRFYSAEDISKARQRYESEPRASAAESVSVSSSTGNPNAFFYDKERGFVTGIEPGLTVAAFRKESGFLNAVFYKHSGERYDSGRLGTGMKTVLPDGTYAVVIYGDVTGEGNVNSRDLNACLDHLLGTPLASGAYTAAADVSGDGAVDLKDALILYRKTD